MLGTTGGGIIVGNDVWIGYETVLLSGVMIGDGAVIGTRAVVTRDVPPYSIVGGVPARVIRQRFDDGTVSALFSLRWWDWPRDCISLLYSLGGLNRRYHKHTPKTRFASAKRVFIIMGGTASCLWTVREPARYSVPQGRTDFYYLPMKKYMSKGGSLALIIEYPIDMSKVCRIFERTVNFAHRLQTERCRRRLYLLRHLSANVPQPKPSGTFCSIENAL